jgi:transcriptional regulator with XRE-family HTH domain
MKKRSTKADRQAPLFWGMSPNQVVAYNLWQARQERGWTQAQAAEALEPYLGVRWTVAQVSAAERSVDGTRVRQFSADDIVAFAQAFRLPVTYFFLPTRPGAKWSKVDPEASTGQLGQTMARMIDVVVGDNIDGAPRVVSRLYEFMADIDLDAYTDAQRRIFDLARHRLLAVVGQAVGSLGAWQESLRHIADEVGQLKADAGEALSRALPDVRQEHLTAVGLGAGDAEE